LERGEDTCIPAATSRAADLKNRRDRKKDKERRIIGNF
jgi:hypothetical protein